MRSWIGSGSLHLNHMVTWHHNLPVKDISNSCGWTAKALSIALLSEGRDIHQASLCVFLIVCGTDRNNLLLPLLVDVYSTNPSSRILLLIQNGFVLSYEGTNSCILEDEGKTTAAVCNPGQLFRFTGWCMPCKIPRLPSRREKYYIVLSHYVYEWKQQKYFGETWRDIWVFMVLRSFW
jgi:hypothetical protein